MGSWRLLRLETYDAFANMAIDEAILTARIENLTSNTLRFYRWKPSAVSIGKFQDLRNEVQLENCKQHGVDVVRRITGGGTVYHDADGEITYSIVADKKSLNTEDITSIYATVYSGIAEALKILGITADFSEGNAKKCPNLTVKGRKISGSAQSHKKGIVLQHGTLLTDLNLDRMFTFLRVPWARTRMEVLAIARSKHTSVKMEAGRDISTEQTEQALIQGFQKAMNTELVENELTRYERQIARRLRREKYSTQKWNLDARHP